MKGSGFDVCVIGGAGHIGLPFGMVLAEAGHRVVCYDVNAAAVDTIRAGKMPFLEDGADELLPAVLGKGLEVTTDRTAIGRCQYVVVVIGTPVDEHLNPRFTVFKRLFDDMADVLRDGQHILLRSTVFPGTTQKIAEYLKGQGKNVRVSFCPERIAQGKALHELRELPQIISSVDGQGLDEARQLFACINERFIVLEPMEAELAKLFTNAWRYIQFSIANQFYEVATRHNRDFYKILRAITLDYPRAAGFPGAGFAAGPCLFKDTMQLAAFSNNSFFLGHAAMLVNEGLPNFIVGRLREKHDLSRHTVGILGMAFKPNIDDKRESLSYKLKKILEVEAKRVLCSDAYIDEPGFVSSHKLVQDSDIIVLGVPHREYAGLEIDASKVTVDIWDFLGAGGLF